MEKMANKRVFTAILAIALVFGMMVVGCDNGSTGGGDPKTVTYQSTDTAGSTTYILIITINGSTASAGDTYVLTIKEAGQPDKVSKGTISAVGADGTLTLQPKNSGSDTFRVSVSGGEMTEIAGSIALDGEEEPLPAPGTLTPEDNVPPEDKPVKDRWYTWEDKDSTATLVYSVAEDGVCTVTVGGTADATRWHAQAGYVYTAKPGKTYSYKFEAWTNSGTRNLYFQYCTDNEEGIYFGSLVQLTTTRQTFTVGGQPLSSGVLNHVEFQCADQLGTFYVKMISITEGSSNNLLGFDYTEYDDEITITGYKGTGGNVTILEQINGKPVTCIGYQAFYNSTSLTSITIPDSVTSIGDRAFYYCYNLTSVTIGSGVTSIGDYAFGWCSTLATINVDGANTTYSSTDGVLYNKNKTTLIQYPQGKAGNSFTIPNSVTNIGPHAFDGCNLTSVTIPNTVTSIEMYAFGNCHNLSIITIPDSVTNISYMAIINCSSLTAINVDTANTAYSSQDGVLYNKNKTTLVAYPGGKTGSFTIPNSVTSIGNIAFLGTKLTSVTIPNSVISIGSQAFDYCSNLTSVTFQGTITSGNLDSTAFGRSGYTGYSDLRAKYLAGGPGTYTRPNGDSETWTKQP